MRLIRLSVEHFASVRSAEVEFGAGLNVLYGPNDLGKSTLAQAIRAALLLPPGSSAHEDFVQWGTDETPRVELVFQVEPDGRLWRIKKAFAHGSDAKATLSSSADGQVWTREARGRKVDGDVRKLLSWGIPEPGGRGGTRGLPQSFLTSVLLAQQTDPAAIFDQSIDADADDSGKQLLTHALQALAQDPLFKQALDEAQRRMDEAFTSTGRKKSGRNAPFKAASDAVRAATAEHDLRREELNRTREVESRIEALTADRLFAEEARDDAQRELAALEEAFAEQATRRELEERVEAAHQSVRDIERRLQTAVEAQATEDAARTELQNATSEVERVQAERARAELGLTEAKDALRQLKSRDAARERELARKTLQARLLELQADENATAARVERCRRAERASGDADQATQAIADLETRLAAQRDRVDELEERKTAADTLREQLRGVALYGQWLDATADAERAAGAEREIGKLRERIRTLESRQAEASKATSGRSLPSAEELQKLRKLHEQRIEAEAKLGVGLRVQVRVKKTLDIGAAIDGEPEKRHRGVKARRSFEAERELTLDIGGLAEVEIVGGAADFRETAEKLEARWNKIGAPVLKAAGVRSLAKLETAVRDAEAAQAATAGVDQERQDLETRVAELDRQAGRAQELVRRAETREASLEAYDREALELLNEKLGPDREADVERLRREAQDEASRIDAERSAAARDLAGLESRLQERRGELARATATRDEALADLGEVAWETALEEATAQLDRIREARAEATERLEGLAGGDDEALQEAESAVTACEKRLTEAAAAIEQAEQRRVEALQALAQAQAETKTRQAQAAEADIDAARNHAAGLQAELDRSEAPDPPVSDEDLEEARSHLRLATDTAQQRSDEIKKLEGALEQVGGDVAREREKMAAEAVARAKDREADLDLDYGAWRLLLETLREVESEESVHLGRALIDPISERFEALTEGRYRGVDVEPGLKTTGIHVAGESRQLDGLSAGLRDQLATLFRLSVAEHLKSLLVLDDQLAQTDPQRVDWFGEVLRECAERFQIIVLTCRPREFLADGEIGGQEAPVRDSASGLLRAIDLAQVVDRI